MNEVVHKAVSDWREKYFNDISLLHIDDQKFVLQFLDDKKVAVDFKELFKDDYDNLLALKSTDSLNDKDINYYIKKDDFDLSVFNNKLIKFPCVGFKFGDYIELFFDYGNVSYIGDYKIKEFFIDEVSVKVGFPSESFQLVFKQLEDDKYLGDWEMNETIKLSGVDNSNYKSMVQQALFYIGYCNPSVHADEYPRIRAFSGKYYNISGYEFDEQEQMQLTFKQETEKGVFNKIKFPEVISFYNAAISIKNEEVSFLYFYKVLEYFFIINQKAIFIENINTYNINSQINDFISATNKIYKQGEEELLNYLLSSIGDEINNLMIYAQKSGLIRENNIDEFSKAIYIYRNSIVHGKGDYKFNLKIPDDIEKKKEHLWNSIIQEIAHILVFKYCLEVDKHYSPNFEWDM